MLRVIVALLVTLAGGLTAWGQAHAARPTKTVFVHASSLRLRSAPSTKAATKGRLQINYGLEVLSRRGDFIKVRTANQATGWVSAAYVAARPLTAQWAHEQARAAKTPKDRLSWLQRAAALQPRDVKVLQALRDGYRAVDNQRGATSVDTLLSVLTRRWFPIPQGLDPGVWVEWKTADWPGAEIRIPEQDWAKYEVSRDLDFWVLPEHGAAVQAQVVEVWPDTWNECGGLQGINLKLNAQLPPGERALVATIGEPPASWKKAITPAPRARLEASFEAYIAKSLAKRGQVTRGLATYEGGAYGHAAVRLGPADESELLDRYAIHRVHLDAAGQIAHVSKATEEIMFLWMPVARRDITGNGQLETVYVDGCATYIQSHENTPLFSSQMRCCGC